MKQPNRARHDRKLQYTNVVRPKAKHLMADGHVQTLGSVRSQKDEAQYAGMSSGGQQVAEQQSFDTTD